MTGIKDLVRPLPGVRRLSLLRQRLGFVGSADFWERRYALGGTSGGGSYGSLGEAKAAFLNAFVRDHGLHSIVEFGCGDGHQLGASRLPPLHRLGRLCSRDQAVQGSIFRRSHQELLPI